MVSFPVSEWILSGWKRIQEGENMSIREEHQKLLEMYAPLRVADVRDGMDWLGYHHYGSLSQEIRPLWRTRACGIERTARYLPYEGPAPLLRGG